MEELKHAIHNLKLLDACMTNSNVFNWNCHLEQRLLSSQQLLFGKMVLEDYYYIAVFFLLRILDIEAVEKQY